MGKQEQAIKKAFLEPEKYIEELKGELKKINEALKSGELSLKQKKELKKTKKKIINLKKTIEKDLKGKTKEEIKKEKEEEIKRKEEQEEEFRKRVMEVQREFENLGGAITTESKRNASKKGRRRKR